MNLLFVSQYYPDSILELLTKYSKVGLDYAANNLCRALVKGFRDNNINFDTINIPHLGSYPLYYKTPLVKGFVSESRRLKSISYINITYAKRYFIKRKVKSQIYKWCDTHQGDKFILFYSYDYISVLNDIKQQYCDVKACVIITDLPEYMATNNGVVTRVNKIMGGDKPKLKTYFTDVDGFVFLAPAMKERLPIANQPWIVIEGIYNPEEDKNTSEKLKEKVVLYTGDLGKRYGIVDLLKAFHGIKGDDYRLWLCGDGDSKEDINRYASIDNRIRYLGLKCRREIINLQKSATLLVNPRHSSEEYTRYSFPSKTMEYMASGTPTLMSHLECIPDEYNRFLYFFNDESVAGMRKSIVEICEKDKNDLRLFGEMAANYIYKYKMPAPQTFKIISFINSL